MKQVMSSRGFSLDALRRLPRRPAEFYAVSDMDTAKRLGGILWIFGGVIVAILIAVWPPTDRIGGAGLAVAGGVCAVCVVAALPLLRAPDRVTPDALFSMSFAAIALLVLLVWIGGGPYAELFILPVLYAAAIHPPGRIVAVYLAVLAGMAAPLLYDGWSSQLAAEIVSRLLLWFSFGFVAMLFAATVRVGRLDLLAGEQEARALARRDPLTGLGNRRAFDEALAQVVRGARRSDRPLSLVLADIEGFKAVNDTFGHLEGDRCLREVAGKIAGTLRPSDTCFRWGGDEFAILLPATDAVQAHAVMDRLREAVSAGVSPPADQPLTLRLGVAEIAPGMSAEELVAAADLALMSARGANDTTSHTAR
jgi:diguanylate cyclase (GGDEF)-like protein